MAEARKIAAVVNPCAAGGETAERWPQIIKILERRFGSIAARLTERRGDATGLARDFLRDGFDVIVAVGGDGTINEVANAFFEGDKPVRPESVLGILSLGTGGDFRRSLAMDTRLGEAIEVLAAGVPLAIDVGKAVFRGPSGSSESRYFVNLASFGMGGEVASRAKNFLSPLGGTTAFLWATLRTFLGYRGRTVRLRLDDSAESLSCFITNVAVGNGRYHGAGMHPCPTAVLNDGVLEVTVIDYLSMFELARDLPILYSDNVYSHPKVHHYRARKIVAEADEPTCVELDGEPLGTLPLEITVLAGRLRVLVSPTSLLLAG